MEHSLTRLILYTEDFNMEKNSKRINLIKALIIIITAVTLLFVLTRILVLKSEDGINQLQALYKQPEDSIDVLFLGSSHVYCDISTGVLWDNYGMASFDLGGAEAPSWISYYQLKEALKTQKPKVVCYEIAVTAMYPVLYQIDEWAIDNNYGMKWNENRIKSLRENTEGDSFYDKLIPLNIMHGRYADLKENDFRNERNSVNYKGFDPRETVIKVERPDISTVTESVACTEKAEEGIRKIIELTKSEGIPLVFFVSPYGVSEEEQKIYNYIEQIAQSENVEFMDFNKQYDEMGLDFDTDFADYTHVNYSGNYKFSNYIGGVLKDKYDIPDRRGDERYVSWEWDAAYQRYERNDLAIRNCDNAGEVLGMAREGYITFSVIDGKAYIKDRDDIVASGDGDFRLTYESGNDAFELKKWVDKGEYKLSLFANDEEYTEYFGNLLFIYDTVNHRYVRSIHY